MRNITKMAMMQHVRNEDTPNERREDTRMQPDDYYPPRDTYEDMPESRRRRDSRGRYMDGGDGPEMRTYNGGYEPEARRRRDNMERYAEGGESPEMRSGNDGGHEYGRDLPESRSRDRRGREHYDDGRFAPQGRMYPGGGRYMPRGNLEIEIEEEEREMPDMRYRPYLLSNGHERDGKIGFASHNETRPFDQQMAQEWTRGMKNADDTTGPKWTQEQAKSLMSQVGLQGVQPFEFWAVLNAQYSDLCKAAKKYGVDRPEFYAEAAKAWIEDKDAVPNKAAAYYENVVKH